MADARPDYSSASIAPSMHSTTSTFDSMKAGAMQQQRGDGARLECASKVTYRARSLCRNASRTGAYPPLPPKGKRSFATIPGRWRHALGRFEYQPPENIR